MSAALLEAPARPVVRIGPQAGPQTALLHCPVAEILFGGARGGGKTFGWQLKWLLKQRRYGRHFNAVMFRREMPQADDAIEGAKELFCPAGAAWSEQRRQFVFPAGGRVRFRPLEKERDAAKYQGQNLTDAAVEEAQQYPSSAAIDRLWGALRSAHGVPTQMILTANPGDVGTAWLKPRFIDPAPLGGKLLRQVLPNGRSHTRVFIRSLITNNQKLLSADPDYLSRLYLVGSEALVAAWLAGDWGAIEGAFFDRWRAERHVLEPASPPPHWTRFCALDWGFARPFSIGWYCVASEDASWGGRRVPRGALVRYREWYGVQRTHGGRQVEPLTEFGFPAALGEPLGNVGVRLNADQVARAMRAVEARAGEAIDYRVADPAIFSSESGPSIAEEFAGEGVFFRPADNKRVAGWAQMRARLLGEGGIGQARPLITEAGAAGAPMLFVTANCTEFLRTVPGLPHDPARAEDLDTEAEDHAADEVRYACMSRPFAAEIETPAPPRFLHDLTFSDLLEGAAPRSGRIE